MKIIGEKSYNIEKSGFICDAELETLNIKETLRKFQEGYREKNIDKVESFMKSIFVNQGNIFVLGTGTDEICLGIEAVKALIKNDWEYWGDVVIEYNNANISIFDNVAWISTNGTVRYSFEDTNERYDSYMNFIMDKIMDKSLTPKQKLTYVNWVLALTYHQRSEGEREYLSPLGFSGILVKHEDKWKFKHMKFAMVKGNFPDERFESFKDNRENYKKQNEEFSHYKFNEITDDIKHMMINFQKDILENNEVKKEQLEKYFTSSKLPYIMGTDNDYYYGINDIMKFFNSKDGAYTKLDMEHAIASKEKNIICVMANGIVEGELSEEKLVQLSLSDIEDINKHKLTSQEKLFKIKRNIAYILNECAYGERYTFPIRIMAIIINSDKGLRLNFMHITFPYCWTFEGKID